MSVPERETMPEVSCQQPHSLQKESARTNLARPVDVTRHDAHFATKRVDHARAVRANETALALALERIDDLRRNTIQILLLRHKQPTRTLTSSA